ncbi:MAG TPA: EAL domain-containing protein [Thermoanaerobaculia bacterium]|nr:EAL domain-containing protein [Thermoanaerobaculia bacterium]
MEQVAAVRSPAGSTQRLVLILDDDENVGRFVRGTLKEPRYRTLWFPDVQKAIEATAGERPDLALVDIGLDGTGTGWDLIKHLRSTPGREDVPVVMLTASADTLNRAKSLRLGADRYLVKPVKADTLRRVANEMTGLRDDLWWALHMPPEEVSRMREMFVDEATELSTLAVVVDDLRKAIESGESLQVFCIEIEPLFRIGERNYWEAFDALRREFVRGLHVMVGPVLGNDVVVATSHVGANDFYCFARNHTGMHTQTTRQLERVARTALRSLAVDPKIAEEVMIFAGGSTTQPHPISARRVLYNAVREAKDSAERRETRYYHGLRERVVRTVHARTIRTVFQPLVDLETRQVFGYEALSRGPAGTEIENPEVIFEIARDFDMIWDLERLCIENVKPFLAEITDRGSLFFNLESHFIQQLQQRGTEVFAPFFEHRHSVVIEITERSAIRDYRTFRHTLQTLKAMGFRIAIDDCGSGYASLEAVAELQPDYLKVGHSLFSGLENDPIRTKIVELVARCAETVGARTIAEAIETEEQLRICKDLGIQRGQGYLFARPAPWEKIRDWRPQQ